MNSEYITTDFYLTCFLTLNGQIIREIRRVGNSSQMEFVFSNSEKLKKLMDDYF